MTLLRSARRSPYVLARDTFHTFAKPSLVEERREARDFFRGFIEAGELAFDIGAHHGLVAEALARIGARVVAVEPNPALAAQLRRRYSFTVEAKAVGATPGEARLRIGTYDGHSTLSDAWVRVVGTDRFRDDVSVSVTTLDDLISEYGTPKYVKIDVEGFEPEVLGGLSQPLELVSLEFQCAASELAAAALDRLEDLGRYEFNLTHIEERRFAAAWGGRDHVEREIRHLGERFPEAYGDLYARLVRPADLRNVG